MKDRIFSIETEYAVSYYSTHPPFPKPEFLIDALSASLKHHYGIEQSGFLLNGSKFYDDEGHAEWSLPECRSAREAALYDKASDYAIARSLSETERRIRRHGFPGKLFVIKNNVDSEGHTYGCHENFSALKQTDWLGAGDQLRLTYRYLTPFLATRQIYSGSGRVGFGRNREDGIGFQIMQRADFIDSPISNETRTDRALFNISRENEPLSSGNTRRIHLILGDANMSAWATWMKLGTTGLLLRIIEDLDFDDIPHLADPVNGMRRISRDPSCRICIPLRDGGNLTAVQIQRIYLRRAQQYFSRVNPESDEEDILREWETTLDMLEENPIRLFKKVDWITKKHLTDRLLNASGLHWTDDLTNSPVLDDLLQIDIRYHQICLNEGLFFRMAGEDGDPEFEPDEIERAILKPPPFTRAKIRGDLISLARRGDAQVMVENWDRAEIDGRPITMDDPFQFFSAEVSGEYADDSIVSHLTAALNHKSSEIRIRAVRAFQQIGLKQHISKLIDVVKSDPHNRVRNAAVRAVAAVSGENAVDRLLSLPQDDPYVKWAVQEAVHELLD